MIKKLIKRKRAYERFKENIWAPDLAEIGSISCKSWGVKYLLWVIVLHGFIK